MVKEARLTESREIIVGTEAGIIYRLKHDNPAKNFYPAHDLAFCANMKKINLRKVYTALEQMITRVQVPPEISRRARGAIEKMVKL
jgi:quinolinate synthase